MSYNCKILADSINLQGNRITTMKITFPRFILAEFNTHRMFSRNSASSRAIPFNKMVKMVEENPFIPIAWQKDHKGMQGTEYFTDSDAIKTNVDAWLKARDNAIKTAKFLNNDMRMFGKNAGTPVTKQLCNRLLEPFMWHTVIITATEWENFFELRCPDYVIHRIQPENDFLSYKSWKDLVKDNPSMKDCSLLEKLECNKSQADIHIQAIAELMWDAMNESTPKQLQAGEWHIPLGDNFDINKLEILAGYLNHYPVFEAPSTYFKDGEGLQWVNELKVKIATARCARISYETLGDNPKIDYEADIRLHDMLLKSKHFSPFEHVARAMSDEEYNSYISGNLDKADAYQIYLNGKTPYSGWCRNFKGFIQYRHLIENNENNK
jgi:hypothetical protein